MQLCLFFNLGTRLGWMPNVSSGRFIAGKDLRHPWNTRFCTSPGRSRRTWKISPPPEIESRMFQPVASRYTNYVNPAFSKWNTLRKLDMFPSSDKTVTGSVRQKNTSSLTVKHSVNYTVAIVRTLMN
jgi:hypothetical protein